MNTQRQLFQDAAFVLVMGILLSGLILVWIKALVDLGKILKDHDDNLNKGKNSKNECEPINPPREINQLDCLLHEPVRLFRQVFGFFRRFVGKLCLKLCDVGLDACNRDKIFNLLRKSNLSVCRFCQFFPKFGCRAWHWPSKCLNFFQRLFRNLKFHNRN